MTGIELGRVLGDAVNALEGASAGIDNAVDTISQVNGKAILSEPTRDLIESESPSMTVEELGKLIGCVLYELESVVMEVESAMDLLWTIDGESIAQS